MFLFLFLILDSYFWSKLFILTFCTIYFCYSNILLVSDLPYSNSFLFINLFLLSPHFYPHCYSLRHSFHPPHFFSHFALLISFLLIDVGIEATIMAAALAQPKSPFRIASSMIHCDPDEYNSYVLTIYLPVYCV